MRRLSVLVLTMATLVSGCVSDATDHEVSPPGADASPRDGARTQTHELTIVQPVGVSGAPAGVAGGSAAFEAPAGTVAITVDAQWNCITTCPMRVALEAPDGTVAAEETRSSNAHLAADPAT